MLGPHGVISVGTPPTPLPEHIITLPKPDAGPPRALAPHGVGGAQPDPLQPPSATPFSLLVVITQPSPDTCEGGATRARKP